MEIGILEGEKVFVKYGKYGRCISCGGTVAVVSPPPPHTHTHARLALLHHQSSSLVMDRVYCM